MCWGLYVGAIRSQRPYRYDATGTFPVRFRARIKVWAARKPESTKKTTT